MLTDENYHSHEANLTYMSVSQYKNFMKCEAATMAELSGEYTETDKEALLVGSYIHAWNEGLLKEFKSKHSDFIYNRKGEPYVAFKKADDMIACLEHDQYCMDMLQGQKEIIMIAEFAGAQWKAKIDVLNYDRGYFVDLKSTRSIKELHWSEKYRQRVSFIEEYDYMLQAAVYAEVERLSSGRDVWLEPVMVAVSKEEPPDKAIISLKEDWRLNDELNKIEDNMPRILAVKSGVEKPKRCGVCKYCRATKTVDRIIHFTELGGALYGGNKVANS